MTLRSAPTQAHSADLTRWSCLACGPAGGADLLQNLLLFIPLGIALGGSGATMVFATALGLLVSLGIELSQAYLLIGRDAALGDVVANTTGTVVGWVLLGQWRTWLLPHGRRGRQFRAGALAIFFGQLWLSGWLGAVAHDPAVAEVRITPVVPDRPVYGGSLRALRLGGQGLVPVLDSAGASDSAIPAEHASVEADLVWEPDARGTGRMTPIVRADDRRQWAVVAIDRREGGLGVELRSRAALLRLRPQTWVLALPAGIETGTPLHVTLTVGNGEVRGTVTSLQDSSITSARYGAQHGWTLINPFTPAHHLGPEWLRWTMAWLAGWGVLLGWWAASATRPWLWGVAAMVGCLGVTTLWHARASNLELLALAVGWLLGAVSSARCRRSMPGS